MEKLLYSKEDCCDILGIKVSTIYALIRAGKLDARKLGNRTVITGQSLRTYAGSLPDAGLRRTPGAKRERRHVNQPAAE